MQIIESYIQHLETLARKLPHSRQHEYLGDIELALNGQLSKTLRKLVPMPALHAAGAFFTSEPMADSLVSSIDASELTTITVLDAACGGGNLLLACARRLPLASTLAATIADWGSRLHGMDIYPEFVRATRARLILLATLRGLAELRPDFFDCAAPSLEDDFPNIIVGNSLQSEWPSVGLYLLNPPFNRIAVPEGCSWATSRVSQAALFISKCLEQVVAGSVIRAILPDVLRSGTNYAKWRRYVCSLSTVDGVIPLGQFDKKTHVHVFLLTLTANHTAYGPHISWVNTTEQDAGDATEDTIGVRCQINVGSVVPQRDPEEGTDYPYLTVHNLPAWQIIAPVQERRKFLGRTFTTPFVAVRRTSRASDANRAVGTVVVSDNSEQQQVAVENHVLVLRPRSGLLTDCEALLERLRDPRTNEWLNESIRCRHLTVGSVQSIPWWPNE